MSELKLFSGSSNPQFAKLVAECLNTSLGKMSLGRFSDGEVNVEILENVRGKDAFIIQSTCHPVNNNLVELLFIADALRRASAKNITAVVPYFGYARQDRRIRSMRVPISAKVVADMMESVGFSRLITVDLHADQIQGFFYIPVDNIYATPVIFEDMHKIDFNGVCVSPDIGGVVRTRAIAKGYKGSDLAIIDKRRPKNNMVEVMNVIGDVSGKDCVIMDDIVDTAGTLCQAALALQKQGANKVMAYCTHPVFSSMAIQNLEGSCISEIVVTDTIPLTEEAKNCKKVRVVSISKLFAEAIKRIYKKESVSSMFS